MRQAFTLEIDSELVRRLRIEAEKAARSPASYVESLIGRAVYGRDYSDVEVIAAAEHGRGTVMRGEDEGAEEYVRRSRSVAMLRDLGGA